MFCLGSGQAGAQARQPSPRTFVVLLHRIIQEATSRDGLAEALPRYFLDRSALLWPNVPIVTGRERIERVLAAQGFEAGTELAIQPVRLLVSGDSSLVLTFGFARWVTADSSREEPGRYLAGWHRIENGWRLGALAIIGMLDHRPVSWPRAMGSPRGGEPVLLVSEVARSFALADFAFADSARRTDASSAFHHWVAPGGVTLDSDGIMNVGPDEVAGAVRRWDGAHWDWVPVAAGAANDGSLGWTAGEATITIPATESRPEQEIRSTYLTLWQRQPDGTLRFVAEGGGTRP